MNRYLVDLAIEILRLYPGQSKVKFAKLIYFTHKELVRAKLVASEDLDFVRMPLGPVPTGFMALQEYKGIKISQQATALMYNSQVYQYVGDEESQFSDEIKTNIAQTLKVLNRMSTTAIVDLAHKESSWKKYINGSTYQISNDDLETSLPLRPRVGKEDDVNLQEQLVEGMLSDIVASSTSLEYPDDEQ